MPAPVSWPDTGTLATIASVIAAFAITMVFFRVQREIHMKGAGEINWIPWADRLLLVACTLALVLVLLPLVAAHPSSWAYQRMPSSACAAAILLVAAYPAALLAHYRFIFRFGDRTQRVNPEPGEMLVVMVALAAALTVAAWVYYLHGL